MFFKIPRLYDSHTHFLATGEFAAGLNLQQLKNVEDLQLIDKKNPNYYRQDWLIGFGWDSSGWDAPPNKTFLDKLFPSTPVFLAKSDGHQCWVNSLALRHLGIESEDGILKEKDHLRAWEALPRMNSDQMKRQVEAASSVFNKAGFTHVRDMSCTVDLWNCLVEMSDKRDLTLAIEENFTIHEMSEAEKAIHFCREAKNNETPFVRMKGIKIFYDGSLGSETAYLSQPYRGVEGGTCGKPLWETAEVREIIRQTWIAGLEISVHCIGDQAAHDVTEVAREVSARGVGGRINLEHAQILRPETIQMMKPLHVRCHMQPCHWLSDRVWLENKLGSIYKNVFPWEALRLAKIPVSFGCDSPIEPPSFWRNLEALEESPKAGIKKFNGNMIDCHSHPDATFCDSFSVMEDGVVRKVVFCGKELISQ